NHHRAAPRHEGGVVTVVQEGVVSEVANACLRRDVGIEGIDDGDIIRANLRGVGIAFLVRLNPVVGAAHVDPGDVVVEGVLPHRSAAAPVHPDVSPLVPGTVGGVLHDDVGLLSGGGV